MTDDARRSDLVDIACEIKRETDKAYQIFDGTQVVWVPKSLCQWDWNTKTLTMQEWLAKDKGLI